MAGQSGGRRDHRGDKDDHEQGGLREESHHHFAARPEGAEGGPDIHCGEGTGRRGRWPSRPTSAMASAAIVKGSRVPIDGMIAAATTIAPNTT